MPDGRYLNALVLVTETPFSAPSTTAPCARYGLAVDCGNGLDATLLPSSGGGCKPGVDDSVLTGGIAPSVRVSLLAAACAGRAVAPAPSKASATGGGIVTGHGSSVLTTACVGGSGCGGGGGGHDVSALTEGVADHGVFVVLPCLMPGGGAHRGSSPATGGGDTVPGSGVSGAGRCSAAASACDTGGHALGPAAAAVMGVVVPRPPHGVTGASLHKHGDAEEPTIRIRDCRTAVSAREDGTDFPWRAPVTHAEDVP